MSARWISKERVLVVSKKNKNKAILCFLMFLGKLMVLQKAIAAAIKAQLSVPWLPSNCRLPLHGETQVNF